MGHGSECGATVDQSTWPWYHTLSALRWTKNLRSWCLDSVGRSRMKPCETLGGTLCRNHSKFERNRWKGDLTASSTLFPVFVMVMLIIVAAQRGELGVNDSFTNAELCTLEVFRQCWGSSCVGLGLGIHTVCCRGLERD